MQESVPSGVKTDGPRLRRLLDSLAPGDVVTVTQLDPLARSTRDLIRARTGVRKGARRGEGRQDGPQTEADPAPAERGDSPPRPGRNAYRDRPQLQCQPGDDFEAPGGYPVK